MEPFFSKAVNVVVTSREIPKPASAVSAEQGRGTATNDGEVRMLDSGMLVYCQGTFRPGSTVQTGAKL